MVMNVNAKDALFSLLSGIVVFVCFSIMFTPVVGLWVSLLVSMSKFFLADFKPSHLHSCRFDYLFTAFGGSICYMIF